MTDRSREQILEELVSHQEKTINILNDHIADLTELHDNTNTMWAKKCKDDFYQNHNNALDLVIRAFEQQHVLIGASNFSINEIRDILQKLKYENTENNGEREDSN